MTINPFVKASYENARWRRQMRLIVDSLLLQVTPRMRARSIGNPKCDPFWIAVHTRLYQFYPMPFGRNNWGHLFEVLEAQKYYNNHRTIKREREKKGA